MFPDNETTLWADENTTMMGNDTVWTAFDYRRDRNALVYIVVVLSFYSLGIVAAMITYLRRERIEMEEEKAYGDYFIFRNRSDTLKRYFQVQRTMDTLNDRGTHLTDKHVNKSRSPGPMDTPMSFLHTNKTGHSVLNDAAGKERVFSKTPEERTLPGSSKAQKKLSRVWEETLVLQASATNN
ncbi:hypothetical protein LSAT2_029090 [Lamellibrachia satsuma]|nr:hypothetical protein LSAT2_029090 [Lamellibrachia satsuma]